MQERFVGPKNLVGVDKAAEVLDVSVNTIYAWVNQRRIPYLKIGRLVKFDIIELEEWIKDKRIKELH